MSTMTGGLLLEHIPPGNGDILSYEDYSAFCEKSGVAGCMIARSEEGGERRKGGEGRREVPCCLMQGSSHQAVGVH